MIGKTTAKVIVKYLESKGNGGRLSLGKLSLGKLILTKGSDLTRTRVGGAICIASTLGCLTSCKVKVSKSSTTGVEITEVTIAFSTFLVRFSSINFAGLKLY